MIVKPASTYIHERSVKGSEHVWSFSDMLSMISLLFSLFAILCEFLSSIEAGETIAGGGISRVEANLREESMYLEPFPNAQS